VASVVDTGEAVGTVVADTSVAALAIRIASIIVRLQLRMNKLIGYFRHHALLVSFVRMFVRTTQRSSKKPFIKDGSYVFFTKLV
jgi:hypothetical protein